MQVSKTRLYGTDIHIVKFGSEIRLDTTLGTPNKREDIRYMFGNPKPNEVTALRCNLSFFNTADSKSEEMGTGRGDCFVNFAYDRYKLYFEPAIPRSGVLWEASAAYMLLREGQYDYTGESGLKSITGANPRTMIGQDAKGNIYVLISEGRKINQKGLTAAEQREVCRQIGLKDAINADGGGSSVAFVFDQQIGKVWDGRYHGRILVGYKKYTLSELPNLKRNAKGVYVNLMQRLLSAKGIPSDPDGKYGPKTEQAVRDYQKRYGLNVDGKCGPQTWGSLTKGVIG